MPIPSTRIDELRSESVQDILGRPPAWMVRCGNSLIFLSVAVLLYLAWLIRYPEIIEAPVKITTPFPPTPLIARNAGKLNLYVSDLQAVKKGQLIAALDNAANNMAVMRLDKALTKLIDDINAISLNNALTTNPITVLTDYTLQKATADQQYNQLGDLQPPYEQFIKSIKEFNNLLDRTYIDAQIKILNQKKNQYTALIGYLQDNLQLAKNQLILTQNNYQTTLDLANKQAISNVDLLTIEKEMLENRQQINQLEQDIVRNTINITDIENTLLAAEKTQREKMAASIIQLKARFKLLQSQLSQFKENYFIYAPIKGQVLFFNFWSSNQVVAQNDEIATILASTDAKIVGQAYVARQGAGRINEGQTVHIKLDRYPYREFGTITGKVESISQLAREDRYRLVISLPKGLTTSYQQTVEFRQEMVGAAEIITDDLRLLERLFNRFRSHLENIQ